MAQDLVALQQEAARRVERMRQHQRSVAQRFSEPPPVAAAISAVPSVPDRAVPEKGPSLDNEQLLLLALILLLYRNNANTELLAALLYILL